jgi:hypothetical protein
MNAFRWYRWAEALSRHPKLSDGAKLLAWQLAAQADNDTGECRRRFGKTSRAALAERLAKEPRAITRAVAQLRAVGALTILSEGRHHDAPEYRLEEAALAEVPTLAGRGRVDVDPARVGGR